MFKLEQVSACLAVFVLLSLVTMPLLVFLLALHILPLIEDSRNVDSNTLGGRMQHEIVDGPEKFVFEQILFKH